MPPEAGQEIPGAIQAVCVCVTNRNLTKSATPATKIIDSPAIQSRVLRFKTSSLNQHTFTPLNFTGLPPLQNRLPGGFSSRASRPPESAHYKRRQHPLFVARQLSPQRPSLRPSTPPSTSCRQQHSKRPVTT